MARKPEVSVPRAYSDYTVTISGALARGRRLYGYGVTVYPEEEWLMLSGIQHFPFAVASGLSFILNSSGPRTCAPPRAASCTKRHMRRAVKAGRSFDPAGSAHFSAALGVSGACDVVEFMPTKRGYLSLGVRALAALSGGIQARPR